MSLSCIAFIKAIILPPTLNFIAIITGLLTLNKSKYFSRLLLSFGLFTLILFCLSPFSNFLLKHLENFSALELPIVIDDEQAIVVLAAGSYPLMQEYGKPIDGAATLERNHYGAFLHKQTNLPLLVTGGLFKKRLKSEAAIMADTLIDSFNVKVKWLEEKSLNTAENAIYSAQILKENNIDSIYLVTHAWHMQRAVMMFQRQNIKVTPAPTIFTKHVNNPDWAYFMPNAAALSNTKKALHEYVGILWYQFRY